MHQAVQELLQAVGWLATTNECRCVNVRSAAVLPPRSVKHLTGVHSLLYARDFHSADHGTGLLERCMAIAEVDCDDAVATIHQFTPLPT